VGNSKFFICPLILSIKKRGQTPVSKNTTSKLTAIIAVVTFVVGAVAVFYSVSLFLASSNPGSEPTSLRLSQWSGYIVASDIHDFSPVVSGVSASWTVPQVDPSENDTFSGVWVGIGGYGEETLIQVGTEQEYVNGKTVYYAWYELLPEYLVRITNFQIRPGDTIAASISLINENTSTWSIKLNDVTRGGRFEKVVVYNSSMLSAEWIVERPKVNGNVSTLANFGNVTFTSCQATLDGVTGPIGNFSYAPLVMHDEADTPLVSITPLKDDGSSFTVSYLEPSSPASTTTTIANASAVQPFITPRRDAFSPCANPKQEQRDST
jgi:hypothetical protein